MRFRRRSRRGPKVLALLAVLSLLLVGAKATAERIASTVSGTVSDEYLGTPVEGALAQWKGIQARTDGKGAFILVGVDKSQADQLLSISADEYETMTVPAQQSDLRLTLRPDTIYGRVVSPTGDPVPRARVVSVGAYAETDDQGEFRLKGVPRDPTLQITAPGYRVATVRPEHARKVDAKLEPFVARALYMGFGMLSLPGVSDAIVQKAVRAGLNSIVVDIKSDRGFVQEALATDLSKEVGASVTQPEELPVLLRRLRERGFYTIARLVVFKDTQVALGKPAMAVKVGGALYRDCEDQYWLDPFNRDAWNYNLDLAEKAAKLGFQEVQFDYTRFPSDCVLGQLVFSKEPTPEAQQAAIEGFLEAAAGRLKPLGVLLSADVFGLTAMEDDIGIGQVMEGIAKQVDYVSPMVYPSTWRIGSFGSDYPPSEPYRIVNLSLKRAVERLKASPAKVRPWLQAFDDYQRLKLRYGAKEVEAQIQAAQDANVLGWMLWDPFGSYDQLSPAP